MERQRLWIIGAAVSIGGLIGGAAVIAAAALSGTPVVAPVLAVAVIAAAVGLPLALRYPDLAVALLIVADLTRVSETTTDLFGVGIFQPLLVLAIISLGFAVVRGRLRPHWSPLYLLALVLFAVRALSVLATGGAEATIVALVESTKDLVFLAVIMVWVTTHRSLKLATVVIVATMATLAGLSVIQEFVFDNTVEFFGLSNVATTQLGAVTLRHTGPEADANFWARSLVLVIPIALAWWAVARRDLMKWMAGGAVAALGMGLYLTQSRGGLIAATVGVLLWLLLAGRPYTRWLIVAPVVLVVLLAIPGVGSRLFTLTDVSVAEQASGDPSLQGRIGAQQAGIGMFLEHPILGVGFGEFRATVPEYQRKLGIQAEVLDAHNLYPEIVAETGAIGLTAWALFMGFGVFVAVRAWLVSGRLGTAEDRWRHLMAAGVVAALVAWLAASVFRHAASLRILYVVLAIGVGLGVEAREASDAAAGEAAASEPGVPDAATAEATTPRELMARYRGTALIGLLTLVVFAAGAWLLLRAAPQRWVAERHVVMATGEEADLRYQAYNYDLITRGLVGATYAAVLEDPEITRRAAADLGLGDEALGSIEVSAAFVSASQVITIRVEGNDADAVGAMAAGIVDSGSVFVAELDEPFVVTAVESDSTDVQRDPFIDIWRVAVLVAVGAAIALGIWWFARSANRRFEAAADRRQKIV